MSWLSVASEGSSRGSERISARSGTGGSAVPGVFERLWGGAEVEQAVLAMVRRWLPTYLWELERQRGLAPDTLQLPRAVLISADIEKMPEDQVPAVILRSPGLLEPPEPAGDGMYVGRWRVDLAAHCVALGDRSALQLARWYALALRALVVQQQRTLDASVRRIDWLDERYDHLSTVNDRTACTAYASLAVEVADVLSRHAGPLEPYLPPEPAPGPTPEWPEAADVDVQIEKVPLQEET